MQRDAATEAVFKPVQSPGQLGISRSTLREALTTLVQSGHLVAQRGRTGGHVVAERPPLAGEDGRPLGDDAWAVLDYRVAIEVGATILPAERAQPGKLDRLILAGLI